MAYELSFSPEFFIGPHDLEGVPLEQLLTDGKPTSICQAVMAMSEEDFAAMCGDVFECNPELVGIDAVLDKIRETNTCRDLRSPVEVYIDEDGWHSVLVY